LELEDNMIPLTSVLTSHPASAAGQKATSAGPAAETLGSTQTDDLQAICTQAPTLPPMRSGLSHSVLHAMGSVLKRVGSTLRLDEQGMGDGDIYRQSTPPAHQPHPALPPRGLSPVKTMPADLSKLDVDSGGQAGASRGFAGSQRMGRRGSDGGRLRRAGSRIPPWAVQSHGLRGLNLAFLLEPEPSLVQEQKQRIDELASPLLVGHREHSNQSLATGLGSLDDDSTLEIEDLQDESFRGSILDFEHFFVQYYVELRPRLSLLSNVAWHLRPTAWRRSGSSIQSVSTQPPADEVARAWKESAVSYIWANKAECAQRWPSVVFSKEEIEEQMNKDLTWQDELATDKSRVVLTLLPESVCHRLLWAVGDAIPAASMLFNIETNLRSKFPQCHVRCADDLIYPPSFFRLLTLVLLITFLQCCTVLWHAFWAVYLYDHDQRRPKLVGPSYGELLDQLAARLLLTGSVAQFLMLQVVAATFPLRSLHTPFQRDLGCLMAYSRTAQWCCRLLGPTVAMALPVAMMLRFEALGLPMLPIPYRFGNAVALGSALSLPLLTLAAAWSVRSSLYSHHHLLMLLLFLTHLGAAFGFATSLEMVKWVVFMATAIVAGAFYLFTKYISEFTSVSLHKAAQLQWACAHIVPVLGILLAAALEVESGMARLLIDYICSNQTIVPFRVCLRLMRNA